MKPKVAVIQFPGSNCDQDCVWALRALGAEASLVWHKDGSVEQFDAVVVPGGFSYGDYLRCGAIARFSPVMQSVRQVAVAGRLVMGICNGFQILCESGLLPGALVRNRSLHFVCDDVFLRIEQGETPFTSGCNVGDVLRVPVAHGEGNYCADDATLDALEASGQVVVRYCDAKGSVTDAANPNGSARNIAGVCNEKRNVFGLMPHPERAFESRLGSADGRKLLDALIANALRQFPQLAP